MFEKYFWKFLGNTLIYAFFSVIFVIGTLAYGLIMEEPILAFPIFFLFFLLVGYGVFTDFEKDHEKEIQKIKNETDSKLSELHGKMDNAIKSEKSAEAHAELWKQTLLERTSGFPTLVSYIEHFEKVRDDAFSDYLKYKKHPAIRASEAVKEEGKRRREAESKYRQVRSLIEYYENIAPFLIDFKNEIIDDEDEELYEGYSEEEQQDEVTHFVSTVEYKKLSVTDRNQLALERFWKRRKSKSFIGKLYERYVGYLYETQGYVVEYVGIFKGREDLGRDLICTKGDEIIVIQCKNWSKFKTIFEKHIFQFFGTVFEYRDKNPKKKVRAIFYSTTQLSELAKRFGGELGIEIVENHKFDQSYPSIKCNISSTSKTRIYHLPFDQQYDNTKIEPKTGEMYCATVLEAESKGFRRAFRWKGNK